MNNETLLALLQVQRIGSDTLRKYFNTNMEYGYTVDGIRAFLYDARTRTRKIKDSYTNEEIIKAMSDAREIIERNEEYGIQMLTFLDEQFPERLRNLPQSPAVLYCKGDISRFDDKCLEAVIWTCNPSELSNKFAILLGERFAEIGITILGGFKTECNKLTFDAGMNRGGRVIAVLPCGLDDVYPREYSELANKIIETGGCLVSSRAVGEHFIYADVYKECHKVEIGLSSKVYIAGSCSAKWAEKVREYAEKCNREIRYPPKELNEYFEKNRIKYSAYCDTINDYFDFI